MDREGGVERTVRARVATAWFKWQEISSLLGNRRIPLKNRAYFWAVCIHSVLLYGAMSWPRTQFLENCIQSCDRWMLCFMAGLSLSDRVSSSEVARRCGVKEISDMALMRRLQWFGNVQRRGEGEPLSVVRSWQEEGRRPRGRPKKWKKSLGWNQLKKTWGYWEQNENLASDRQS